MIHGTIQATPRVGGPQRHIIERRMFIGLIAMRLSEVAKSNPWPLQLTDTVALESGHFDRLDKSNQTKSRERSTLSGYSTMTSS